MTVDYEEMPRLRVAAVHHVGPYNQIPQAFERLGALAGRAGLFNQPERPMMLAIYYDDPETTPAKELRAEAGIVVPEEVTLPEDLSETHIPAGRYARTRHIGPYERLPDTWARLMGEWLPSSGHRVGAGPSLEVYRNTPMEAPSDKLVTDLYVPIAR